MNKRKESLLEILLPLRNFGNWLIVGVTIGAIGGILGAVFHLCIDKVTELRAENPWIIALLPLGGVLIALLYHVSKVKISANEIISAVRSGQKLPFMTLPVIFSSTVITQLVGGSAGKEGAAIQMGGTIGYEVGGLFHLDEKDRHVAVMCGLASVFAAVFGTPITAAVFALEVVSVGEMCYAALIPCIPAVLVAGHMAELFSVVPLHFTVSVPELNLGNLAGVALLAVLCAFVSILFCLGLHKGSSAAKKLMKNAYLRAAAGGILLIGMTLLSGGTEYNGAGFNLVNNAMAGKTEWYAFAVKMLFTVVTVSCGFKGGEIVPTMAIGAALGCSVAKMLGMDPEFFAAIGLLSLFCGMVNCPMASVMMGVELFGGEGLVFYAAACMVSYTLSGKYSLYSSQKLLYAKTRAELVNERTEK